jgi:hypothetical protein
MSNNESADYNFTLDQKNSVYPYTKAESHPIIIKDEHFLYLMVDDIKDVVISLVLDNLRGAVSTITLKALNNENLICIPKYFHASGYCLFIKTMANPQCKIIKCAVKISRKAQDKSPKQVSDYFSIPSSELLKQADWYVYSFQV